LFEERDALVRLRRLGFAANAFRLELDLERMRFAAGAKRGKHVPERGADCQRNRYEDDDQSDAHEGVPVRSKCTR